MMHFQQIPARDVRAGALFMIELGGKHRIVRAITNVSEVHGALQVRFAERIPPAIRTANELVWIAQH